MSFGYHEGAHSFAFKLAAQHALAFGHLLSIFRASSASAGFSKMHLSSSTTVSAPITRQGLSCEGHSRRATSSAFAMAVAWAYAAPPLKFPFARFSSNVLGTTCALDMLQGVRVGKDSCQQLCVLQERATYLHPQAHIQQDLPPT